jgi:TRAP-type C4-dicarboxylate transport system permease small subunit
LLSAVSADNNTACPLWKERIILLKVLSFLDKFFQKTLYYFLVASIIVMVGFTAWQVLCRYVLLISVPYAEEFARLAVVWCIYLGSALSTRYGDHISVNSLVNLFPRPLQFFCRILTRGLVILMGIIMIKYGITHVQFTATDVTTALGYSRSWFYVPAPIAGAFITIYTILEVIQYTITFFRPKKVHIEASEV